MAEGGIELSAPPDPDTAWAQYSALAITAANTWQSYRMQKAVARTDGTAGFLYRQAYEAQQAADAAYAVWQQANEAAHPGVTG